MAERNTGMATRFDAFAEVRGCGRKAGLAGGNVVRLFVQ
jgi:hypothetical protein